MPFTLAHPAAAVPLARYKLSLSALVIGSMAPDFPYFLHRSIDDHYGHSLQGLFLFCIPAGLLALWLFHRVLKFPLLWLLPKSHQSRLGPFATQFRFGPPRELLLIILALLIGACTHLIWDSFTHAGGWSVQHLPMLSFPLIQRSGSTLYVFKVLQHGSTIIGVGLLLFWYSLWFERAPVQPISAPVAFSDASKSRLIILMAALAFLVATFAGIRGTAFFGGIGWIQPFARIFVVRGIAVLWIELFVFSVFWHVQASRHKLK